jgi:predicted O-methyltransferase YrrM
MTLEELEILSHRPYVPLPTLSGFDPANPYYAFLYHLSKEMGPMAKILEIGTDKGDGAAHLAAGRADSLVWTVDIASSDVIYQHLEPFPNATFLHRNVNDMEFPPVVKALGPFDILFEDGEHSGAQVAGEWQHYVPSVRHGGVIVMDDINLPTGIRDFWDAIPWPKIELSHLHNTGFGVVVKP